VELYVFARFRAHPGQESAVEHAIRSVIVLTREESGCLKIDAFRSTRDPQLFYIHSTWKDEAAFDRHATLPHTVEFLAKVEPLTDHPLDVTRSVKIR